MFSSLINDDIIIAFDNILLNVEPMPVPCWSSVYDASMTIN